KAISREKVQSLDSYLANTDATAQVTSRISTPAELGSLKRAMTPFQIAFPLLIQRSFISFCRDTPAIVGRSTQVLSYAVLLALFFAPLKSDYESIQSRFGFIQELVGESAIVSGVA